MAKSEAAIRAATCTCGRVALECKDAPIVGAACYCASCQKAGTLFEELPGGSPVLAADRGTPYALYRKDRVRCVSGAEVLREHRLTPSSKTRRVVASCCNAPIFVEFAGGHWLSIYQQRFPAGQRPPIEMRTMTRDAPAGIGFDDGLPSYRTHSGRFMWRLLAAWVAMGFRAPRIDYVHGILDLAAKPADAETVG
jgi:hypothetical protein